MTTLTKTYCFADLWHLHCFYLQGKPGYKGERVSRLKQYEDIMVLLRKRSNSFITYYSCRVKEASAAHRESKATGWDGNCNDQLSFFNFTTYLMTQSVFLLWPASGSRWSGWRKRTKRSAGKYILRFMSLNNKKQRSPSIAILGQISDCFWSICMITCCISALPWKWKENVFLISELYRHFFFPHT